MRERINEVAALSLPVGGAVADLALESLLDGCLVSGKGQSCQHQPDGTEKDGLGHLRLQYCKGLGLNNNNKSIFFFIYFL